MTTDISITVNVDKSPALSAFSGPENAKNTPANLHPTGISISYGINSIPVATLELPPTDLWLVCDIEKWRRTPVVIVVRSISGCLTFKGLIDGVSISQTVGDMRMQLIVKHYFQVLNEINPLLMGYHSNGLPFTKRMEALQCESRQNNAIYLQYLMQNENDPTGQKAFNEVISYDQPIFNGFISMLRVIMASQQSFAQISKDAALSGKAAIAAAKTAGERHLALGLELMSTDRIKVDHVATTITLQNFLTLDWVLSNLTSTRGSLFELFIGLLDTLGCGLVIGNDHAYVVPTSGFLLQSHEAAIVERATSPKPNIVYPADYTSVSFSDSGYRDIRGVYVMSSGLNPTSVDSFFEDTASGGSGGVIGEALPPLIRFRPTSFVRAGLNEEVEAMADQTKARTGDSTASGTKEEQQETAIQDATKQEWEKVLDAKKEQDIIRKKSYENDIQFSSQWAQLRYYILKYSDRVGSYTTRFAPKYAPGCVGSIYIREPGVFIDHFVQQVTHDIRLTAPDAGSATTSVTFNCGRMGSLWSAAAAAGLPSYEVFDALPWKKGETPQKSNGYTAETSAKVAKDFISDTTNLIVL